MNESSHRILVLGDLMLDRYTWATAERVSPEAPVVVLRAEEEEVRLGGAASVAALIVGLGSRGVVGGVLGDDPAGRTVERLLAELWPQTESIVVTDVARPTTVKHRLLARASNRRSQQIVRLDSESRRPLNGESERRLADAVVAQRASCDAILISDYNKGVCTPALVRRVIRAARTRGLPIIVDPALGADYKHYRGATLIKPNRPEAELACGRAIASPEAALNAGRLLCRRHGFSAAVITLDREGLVLTTADGFCRHWSDAAREVCDVTGAGDTVLVLKPA